MMKYVCLCILCCVCLFSCGPEGVFAEDNSVLPAPEWEVGDWWIVEVETYGECVSSNNCIFGSVPRHKLRFQVEAIETIENEPYFVVFIRYLTVLNADTYRFWFRVSDRYIGRYERYDQGRHKMYAKDYDPEKPQPLVSRYIPVGIPITIPIFEVRQERTLFTLPKISGHAMPLRHTKNGRDYFSEGREFIQEIRPAKEEKVAQIAARNIKNRNSSTPTYHSKTVTIQNIHSKHRVIQTWNPEFPWNISGAWYRYFDTIGEHRFFQLCQLIEFGKE